MTDLQENQTDQVTLAPAVVSEEGERRGEPSLTPDVSEEGERRSTAMCGCSNHGFVGDTCAQCGSTF